MNLKFVVFPDFDKKMFFFFIFPKQKQEQTGIKSRFALFNKPKDTTNKLKLNLSGDTGSTESIGFGSLRRVKKKIVPQTPGVGLFGDKQGNFDYVR